MPNWTPGTDLASPAVRGSRLEEDCNNLWHEFLKGYFDGENIELLSESLSGVTSSMAFQQSPIPQPLDSSSTPSNQRANCAIHVVWIDDKEGARPERRWLGSVRKTFQNACFKFYIRAKGRNTGDGGPEVLARKTADLLYGILNNKNLTLPLARKGIRHIRADRHNPEPSAEYVIRSMHIRAQLQFVSDDEA